MADSSGTGLGRSIDVRNIPVGRRHPLIFAAFDALADGQAITLLTDHEPRPLHAEFGQSRRDRFAWTQRCVADRHWEAVIRKVAPSEDSDDVRAVIRRCAPFAHLAPTLVERLAESSRIVAIRRNRAIVEQGIVWPHIGIVGRGNVQAVLVTPDGREVAAFEMLAGEMFGAIALVDGGASPLRYVARAENTVIALFSSDAVLAVMHRDSASAAAVNALSGQRLRAVLQRFSAHAAQPITARVAEALLAYAKPIDGLAPALPPLPDMPQTELAVAAGTGKDIVYRAIAELEEAGALSREGGKIVRLDRSKLHAFSEVLKY